MTRQFFFIDTMRVNRDQDNYRDDRLKQRMMFLGTREEAEAHIKKETEKLEVNLESRKQAATRDLKREVKSLIEQLEAADTIEPASLQALGIYPEGLRRELAATTKNLEKLEAKPLSYWEREGDDYVTFGDIGEMTFNWGLEETGEVAVYDPGTVSYDPSEY